jgi:putative transposase
MRRSYKFRIYPNKIQREALDDIFYFNKFLYYSKYKKSISYNSQAAQLPEIKKSFADQANIIYSQTLQQTLKRLDNAYKNFFRRVKSGETPGFPRFKRELKSVCFPQCDLIKGGVKRLQNNKIKVFGIDTPIRIKWHREIKGKVKQVFIKKSADKYYLIAICDGVPAETHKPTGKIIAIDLGIETFITTDDGGKFHHPKPYKTAKEKLAYLNRKLALKQKNSNNRKRAKLAIQRAHEKVANIRADFQHKLSKQIVSENDTVIVEKLNISNMLEAKGYEVNKQNITDASWGNFITILKYKAESAGIKIIEVDPKNTSKMCSCCGNIKKELPLSVRLYECEGCGFKLDRDINAAINIRNIGLGMSPAVGKTISEAHGFIRE